jgi:hypothetical protein
VDEDDFQRLSYENGKEIIWYRQDVPGIGLYCAVRWKKVSGNWVKIFMAREILGLPHGVGHGSGEGDHKNHDNRDNSQENLRNATTSQNRMNREVWGLGHTPKGVRRHGNGYRAFIYVEWLPIFFYVLSEKNEAWFMRKEAEKHVQGEYAHSENIPDDQMPTPERQKELREMVVEKLRSLGLA